jgi:hypothetical protein
MKKFFLLVIMIGLFEFSWAQVASGTKQIGGRFNFSIGSGNDGANNSTNFTFVPAVGVFISDQLAIGAGVGITSTKTKFDNSDSETSSTGVIFSPYARYHIPVSENFYFYGEGSVGITAGNTKNTFAGNETKGSFTNFNIGINPGILYFVGEKVGLEASVGFFGYSTSSSKPEDGDRVNQSRSFSISLNPNSLNFGIRYYLQ